MRSLLILSFLLTSLYICAQDTAHIVDRVSTTDSKNTIGQITMDKKGDFLLIDVYGKGVDTINYSRITTVEYRIDNPRYDSNTLHIDTFTALKNHADIPATLNVNLANDTAIFAMRCVSAPYYPERRRAGIGFTVGGIVMMGAGAALIALAPRESNTNFTKSISPGTAAGFILAAAGISMTIPGALIWSRYPHGYRRKK
jgi:hypothetical protein